MAKASMTVRIESQLSDGRSLTREPSVWRGDLVKASLTNEHGDEIHATLDAHGTVLVVVLRNGKEQRIEMPARENSV